MAVQLGDLKLNKSGWQLQSHAAARVLDLFLCMPENADRVRNVELGCYWSYNFSAHEL